MNLRPGPQEYASVSLDVCSASMVTKKFQAIPSLNYSNTMPFTLSPLGFFGGRGVRSFLVCIYCPSICHFILLDMGQDVAGALLKLGLALVIGTIIGAEREYKNKSAGLRTLILICLGSTLFTIISSSLGAESETGRIASNIVTGIGFLGAGAIMREGLTVTGLTTASSIWVTAALGMAVGAGEYYLSVFGTVIVLVVLTLFGFIQPLMERYKKAIELHITFTGDDETMLEDEMNRFNLNFVKIRAIKKEGNSVFQYEVSGPKKELNLFLKTLNQNKAIKSFEY